MDLRQIAQDVADGLAAAYPARIVTRDFVDPMQRPDADVTTGLFTVLTLGADELDAVLEQRGQARLLIVGQVKVAEDTDPHLVEDAELQLFHELREFAEAPGAGLCPFYLQNVAFSAQLDHPYGWFRSEAVYAELD